MSEKRCSSVRDHKPHLWSRTTRRTVTEETAGDTFQCPGRARLALRADTRGDDIRADARSGTNWASVVSYGPACVCGAFPPGAVVTSHGREVPKGACHRHGVIQPSRHAREGGN